MNFSKALELLKQGKKVRRKEWGKSTKIFIRNGQLFIDNDEEECNYANTSAYCILGDMLADDWEEYKSPLSDEEKEYLKMIIKFYPEKIEKISIYRSPHYTLIYLEYGDKASYKESYLTGSNHFENMEVGKHYTLKELGLDE